MEKNLRFDELQVDSKILRSITDMGFEEMTPIQAEAIPAILSGKDVIGQAQTGTGKTAAFGIPMLNKIDMDNKRLQAVILCPTRELAIQVAEEIRKLADQTKKSTEKISEIMDELENGTTNVYEKVEANMLTTE
ncbi:MAG: DEAD/DEAH box helicase, partial [Clostridiales bacterium]|nr:DEAD/DEAH box helicase [Clostridiales bacterium]